MNDARKEMSVFLKRQTVRRNRDWTKRLRQAERVLISVAIIIAGLACLYGLYSLVFLGQTFAVKKISVEGSWRNLNAEALAKLSGVNEGDNLFWVSVAEVHERLGTDPWVKASAVRRRLPDTLWIYVEEYQPSALLVAKDGLFFIDAEGHPFKRVEPGDDKDLPVLTGLELEAGNGIEWEDELHVWEMIKLIDLFRNSEFGRNRDVAEVNYDSIKGFSLITKSEPVQILFGHAAFADRIALLDRISGEILKRAGRIQYMLANEPQKIIVKYQTS